MIYDKIENIENYKGIDERLYQALLHSACNADGRIYRYCTTDKGYQRQQGIKAWRGLIITGKRPTSGVSLNIL